MIKLVAEINALVECSDLLLLVGIEYKQIDKGLICAFVKHWKPDTSNVYLHVGEMTITLDDVSQLLHIPIVGQFFNLPAYLKIEAAHFLVQLLEVSYEEAIEQMGER